MKKLGNTGIILAVLLIIMGALSACGGGGSGDGNTAPIADAGPD